MLTPSNVGYDSVRCLRFGIDAMLDYLPTQLPIISGLLFGALDVYMFTDTLPPLLVSHREQRRLKLPIYLFSAASNTTPRNRCYLILIPLDNVPPFL